jgi:hypothetical protein
VFQRGEFTSVAAGTAAEGVVVARLLGVVMSLDGLGRGGACFY